MKYSTFYVNHFLENPVQYLKGVGPKRADLLNILGYKNFKDVILSMPVRYIDRRKLTAIKDAISGDVLNQVVKIEQIHIPKNKKQKVTHIICSDHTGNIDLTFFHFNPLHYIQFKEGVYVAISGKVEKKYGHVQMAHPDIFKIYNNDLDIFGIEPMYHSHKMLSSRSLSKIIEEVLKILPQFPEWLPLKVMQKFDFPDLNQALRIIHQPKDDIDLQNVEKAIGRMAFDELLIDQFSIYQAQKHTIKTNKYNIIDKDNASCRRKFTGLLQQQYMKKLPYVLTESQKIALQEINADQLAEHNMLRVLQGDVGSGKTVVIFLSAINMIEIGYQSVIMAPTEILAKQHFETIKKLFGEDSGIRVALLISKLNVKEKREVQRKIAEGEVDIIIGTHALIQNNILFHKLGLVVIDEQHKFGVMQRLELVQKGMDVDFLMISATPIPRTLRMICYGNIDISTIKEKPYGSIPVITSVLQASRIHELIEKIKYMIAKGSKVYWICPLIEESEALALNDVTARYASLKDLFGDKTAMMHGRMKVEEREIVMNDFSNPEGVVKILVSTTVIEVGVDVQDADIIVIENAERFGLAQIHQLRGRVGRRSKQSYCILLHSQSISTIAQQRLQIIKQCNDGFVIAEEDLKIRGGGKIIGSQQSGLRIFKIFNTAEHHYFVNDVNNIVASCSIGEDMLRILLKMYCDVEEAYIEEVHKA